MLNNMLRIVALTTFVVTVLARTPPQLSCYNTGVGPAISCGQFICDFCKGVAKAPLGSGESGGACYNLFNGKRCNFSSFNSGNSTSTGAPSEAACNIALWTVAGSCDLGGTGIMDWSPGSYTFGVKPYSGTCGGGTCVAS